MPSFDVVNRLNYQEIDNAIGNSTREITNRYDFKGLNYFREIIKAKVKFGIRHRKFRYFRRVCRGN